MPPPSHHRREMAAVGRRGHGSPHMRWSARRSAPSMSPRSWWKCKCRRHPPPPRDGCRRTTRPRKSTMRWSARRSAPSKSPRSWWKCKCRRHTPPPRDGCRRTTRPRKSTLRWSARRSAPSKSPRSWWKCKCRRHPPPPRDGCRRTTRPRKSSLRWSARRSATSRSVQRAVHPPAPSPVIWITSPMLALAGRIMAVALVLVTT